MAFLCFEIVARRFYFFAMISYFVSMKLVPSPTLADSICDLRTRKIKKQFFTQINTLLDWESISSIIDIYYRKGKSATGKPSNDGLLLFRMCLLQTWYGS